MPFIKYAGIALLLSAAAQGDFSYTMTRKQSGGVSVAGRNSVTKFYIKGAKMKVDRGNRAVIVDFDAGAVTTIDEVQKTVSTRNLRDAGASDPKVEVSAVKETGSHKTIGGHNAVESSVTTDLDSEELRQTGASLRLEMNFWLADDVPGAAELREFYRRHESVFPWNVLKGDGNPAIEQALTGIRQKIAGMTGVPVLEVVAVKPAHSGGTTPGKLELSTAEATKMRDQVAELDAIIQKGGPEAASAARSLALLNAVLEPRRNPDASGALFEITFESADFSDASIPDSVFAPIPQHSQGKD
jgi:hypothetical protein